MVINNDCEKLEIARIGQRQEIDRECTSVGLVH